jgi:hypothetical protein
MQTRISRFLTLLACTAILSLCAPHLAAQNSPTPQRITQPIDEKNLVVLKGNTYPLALPQYDQGAVSDALPLHRMLLLLQRGAGQEAALEQLLDQQQDKSSLNYHAWLTPRQFGQQFGPTDADIQTITNWLQSHGFQITNVTSGRTLIEFSGTAAQVHSAFHTQIHSYLINGQLHTANSTDPQIPAALAPVVAGPVSLNNFPISSHLRQLGTFHRSKNTSLAKPVDKPLYTFEGCTPDGCFALGPADFATIYNSAPLLAATPVINGNGQTIAIVGESDINPTDVTDFQTMFGLTPNFSAANNIIVNGADPGANGTEGESDLDVQWAGAVAPGATIKFVTSESTETTAGIVLSALYIVENNLAGVMSESFGACEQQIGSLNQFHNALWQQASAQGITAILSAGDGGSAGCDNFDTAQTAMQGLAVSGFASTPYNIAVGGTDFDEINKWTQYWSSTNTSTNQSSALSYIPEIPWNQNCAQLGLTGCGASAPNGSLNIVAGSGGASTLYPKPSWQSGSGVPNDGHRDLPDLSLFASGGFDGSFYIVCQKDVTGAPSCNLTDFGFTFQGVGGTSASAPAFAGIMALVNQSQATSQNPAPRQGNANYVLYSLFKKQTGAIPAINCNSSATPSTSCTFYDVTRGNSALTASVGTNSVPCSAGSRNCSISTTSGPNGVLVTPANSQTEAYTVTTGYDLATGLGSVNIANLVKNWSSVTSLPSTTTLSAIVNGQAATSIAGITHGTPVNLSSTVTAGQGATGTPTGSVALLATPNPVPTATSPTFGFDVLALSDGTATGTNAILPGGQYNLTAHYQGDGTFGSSDSTPGIPVNISAEPSKTLISIPTFDPSTGAETGNTPTSLFYGSPYIARIDVGNALSVLSYPLQPLCAPPACPTGTITRTDSLNGAAPVPLDGGTFALNSAGYTEDQSIQLLNGSHVLTATYSGDRSYAASSGTYSLTVIPVTTTTALTASTMNAVVGNPFGLTADVKTNTSGAAPSCNAIVFKDGSTVLNLGGDCLPTAGSASGPAETIFVSVVIPLTPGVHSYTASYTGERGYSASVSVPVSVTVKLGTTLTMQAAPAQIFAGQSTTLTALTDTTNRSPTAAPTGTVTFTGSGTGQIGSAVTCAPTTDPGGNEACQASVSYSPIGTETVTATYSGDTNYAANNFSAPLVVIVTQPTVTIAETSITVAAGSSGGSTITLTPVGPFAGNVIVTASNLPPGVTCPSSPLTISVTGPTAAGTFNCQVSAPSTSLSAANLFHTQMVEAKAGPLRIAGRASGDKGWWKLSAGAGFAAVFLLFLPGKKQYRAVLVLVMVSVVSFTLGCGGGGSSGVGGPPTPTLTQMTVSADKVASGTSFTFSVSVTGGTPNGSVQLFDGSTPIGTPATVSDGKATPTAPALSVGTHSISAHYLGDGNTQASQSGVLNLTVTGATTVAIITNPVALPPAAPLNLTIN